jgi:uncharacterized alkaline shock family protein YloU
VTADLDTAESVRHAAPLSSGGATALPALPDPEERGTLTVAEKVVERVAGYAVTRVDGAGAAPRRLLGVKIGEARPDTEAAVTARVDGHAATVRATVTIAWPNSVHVVADRLRAAIREDVDRMAGVQVAQVDLEVVSFATPPTPSRRVQ